MWEWWSTDEKPCENSLLSWTLKEKGKKEKPNVIFCKLTGRNKHVCTLFTEGPEVRIQLFFYEYSVCPRLCYMNNKINERDIIFITSITFPLGPTTHMDTSTFLDVVFPDP